MPQSLGRLLVHFVWSTKERTPWIADAWAAELYSVIGGLSETRKSKLLAAGGVADHVHLLVSMARDVSVSDMARVMKGGSSRWISDRFDDLRFFRWQEGYGAFSVSHSGRGEVEGYIAGRPRRHARQSFQNEYRELLALHEIDYDEKYVWD